MQSADPLLSYQLALVIYFLSKTFQGLSARKLCFYLCITWSSFSGFHGSLSTWLRVLLCLEKVSKHGSWSKFLSLTVHFPPLIYDTNLFSDSFYDSFYTISDVMFFCQILAVVEVLNAAFGIVQTGVGPTLIQVCCECFSLNFKMWNDVYFHDNKNVLPGGWKEFYPLHHFW